MISRVRLRLYPLGKDQRAEGCFFIFIYKSKTKLEQAIQLKFQITQHYRDEQLINNIISYLKAGKCYYRGEAIDFVVAKFEDLINIIIPFFNKFPIIGVKALDFEDWCKVAKLMENKAHLTSEGLEEIKQIKAGTNRGRY